MILLYLGQHIETRAVSIMLLILIVSTHLSTKSFFWIVIIFTILCDTKKKKKMYILEYLKRGFHYFKFLKSLSENSENNHLSSCEKNSLNKTNISQLSLRFIIIRRKSSNVFDKNLEFSMLGVSAA